MNIKRNKAESAPKPFVSELAAGTVFKIGKKLYLKTDESTEAVRLTKGTLASLDDIEVSEVVEGEFVYA